MKCLIVEDNRQNYQLLQQMLKDYGESEIAENGLEAIRKFETAHSINDPYDVIFLDIMMPELDGSEVLKKIRNWENAHLSDQNRVQIVMASSKSDTDTIVSSFDDGCQHFYETL